ncbi:GDCCVxC domain-containing (seleno)protein [Varunaivibrio sulfuroxidans]|uniref:Uncharacterized protein n=1 Tax=Varunaivibrio sulfuroxidans TaxID=1773489 RepID=A0A4V2UP81_9PROT|nr:GDCCVxC domain-containing (seleno)protein [Varunaivibrio sulfuroxidans]TCS64891.1 hypothetical protein EDD55_101222 [Varunaivibrio sulfuroxidans]WES29814.1 GDCCVxC domain-containing (seleno)protein [Varunaivibrio sulfuroxidans]
MDAYKKNAVLTCPHCGLRQGVVMATQAVVSNVQCNGCGRTIRAKDGEHCVYCAHGDTPCPPAQREKEEKDYCWGCTSGLAG